MVNSIQKGKGFERQIVKQLVLLTGSDWKRVPMSGAFSTVNKSEDKRFFGDVFTENEKYKDLVVECKKTKQPITLFELVNPKSRISEWLEQTERESKGKDWILIFSWNNSKIFYICQKKEIVDLLNIKNTITLGKYFFGLFQ
jgi:Holliday junction resolvase